MKKVLFTAALLLGMTGTVTAARNYSSTSQLASGNWAKIGVETNGVYEITYGQLRELGFTDPSKVSVMGDGAPMYPYSFIEGDKMLIPDRVTAIPVWHKDGKLYFYGKGPENIGWNDNSQFPGGAGFSNYGRNIYTNYGIYFLTDAENAAAMATEGPAEVGEDAATIDKGFGYFCHEIDRTQSASHSGKVFWGESFANRHNRSQSFPFTLNSMVEGTEEVGLEFNFMSSSISQFNIGISTGGIKNMTISGPPSNGAYNVVSQKSWTMNIASKTGSVDLSLSPYSSILQEAYLDYLLLTYPRTLTFDSGEKQFTAHISANGNSKVACPAGEGVVAWDVTNPDAPVMLSLGDDNTTTLSDGEHILALFNTGEQQNTPAFMKKVKNQNIHSLAMSTDPDMIIITTDEFLTYAQQLADFHKQYDNMEVTVLVANNIYNEFSSGRPDPMAYRNMARMFYKNGEKLKNILLYGPTRSDVKYVEGEDHRDFLVLLQSEESNVHTETYGFVDAYGILSPDRLTENYLLTAKMDVGVGILPVNSTSEAELINEKIANYYFDETKPYWADRIAFMADDADEQLHVNQSEELINILSEKAGDAPTPVKVYLGEYGFDTPAKLFRSYREGNMINNYIGHGSLTSICMYPIITTSDIPSFDNKRLAFINFAGCMATMYENGQRGIPEHMLLTNKGGLIGGQMSVRSSWSNENRIYMNEWHRTLLNSRDVDNRTLPIGNLTMNAKNQSPTMGRYKFHLICDPALRIGFPSMRVSVEAPAQIELGGKGTVKGKITDIDGTPITDFNGNVVVKWFAKPKQHKLKNQVSDFNDGTVITIEEDVVDTQTFTVSNGEFEFELLCPRMLDIYLNDNLKVSFVGHDMTRGALAMGATRITPIASENAPAEDNESPVIETLTVGGDVVCPNFTINAIATDNEGLRIDGMALDTPLQVLFDGKWIEDATANIVAEEGSRRILLSLPMSGISEGFHTVAFKVRDYAGNQASLEKTFKVATDNSLPAMELEERVCRTNATLTLPMEAASAAGDAKIIITDAFGRTILTKPFDSDKYVWNLCDEAGNRVVPGIYRAYTTFQENAGSGTATRQVTIPVIDAVTEN